MGGEGTDPNDMGLSRKHIMQAIEVSLKRLNTDYLDIYYAHMPDYNRPLEETIRTKDDIVRQGKVRYLGCSNFRAFQLFKDLWINDKNNLARWDVIQPPLYLLTRNIEYELLSLCRGEGIGVCPYSPMAAGLLSGKYEQKNGPMAGVRFSLSRWGYTDNQKYWNDLNFSAIEGLKKIAQDHGKSLLQFALAWVLSTPGIPSIVNGASSMAE